MSRTLDLFSNNSADCNRVKIGGRTELLGDPSIKPEKPHTIISFPGGDLEVARTEEGLYWVHIAVRDKSAFGGATSGRIVRARIDADGRYSDEANRDLNAAIEGELLIGGVNHIAFLIQPGDQ